MQTAAQAAHAALSSEPSPVSAIVVPEKLQAPRCSAGVLDNFWARMVAMYGHGWASQYGETPDGVGGDTWSAALAGLTAAQIGEGLRATLHGGGGDFPPSAPHFRERCFGIPAFAAARFEMTHGDVPRTPFGLLCWRFVDTFRLRTADQREADRLARDAYDLAKAHVMAGGGLPEVHAELAKPEPAAKHEANPETVARVLAGLNAKLGAAA